MPSYLAALILLCSSVFVCNAQSLSKGSIVSMSNSFGTGSNKITHLIGQTFYTEAPNLKAGMVFVTSANAALPVSLVQFSASYNPLEGIVNLRWETSSEVNNHYFEIEKSTNGFDFKPFGIVEGNGTTSRFSNYHMVDVNPAVGMNYYRLKQVDFDGGYAYFPIESVFVPLSNSWVKAYPNPFQEIIQLEFLNLVDVQEMQYELLSARGQVVSSGIISGQKGIVPTADLSAGIYYLKLQMQQQTITLKLQKQ